MSSYKPLDFVNSAALLEGIIISSIKFLRQRAVKADNHLNMIDCVTRKDKTLSVEAATEDRQFLEYISRFIWRMKKWKQTFSKHPLALFVVHFIIKSKKYFILLYCISHPILLFYIRHVLYLYICQRQWKSSRLFQMSRQLEWKNKISSKFFSFYKKSTEY